MLRRPPAFCKLLYKTRAAAAQQQQNSTMETLQSLNIIEVHVEAHEEVYHALKMLEHSSIVQRSMPQCEFHPSTHHIEEHIRNRISAALGVGPLQQAKNLLVTLTRLSTSYDRPMLPQVRTFVLDFLSETVQKIPADRKSNEVSGKDRELLIKTFLQELLVNLDFRLLTLWCEILKFWRHLVSLVEYKTVRELLPLLFEQAGKMPSNLELATVPVKQAVNDYIDVTHYVIDRQNAFLPSLLVIDYMKRTFAPASPPLSANIDGTMQRKSTVRESPPAYKHSTQQKFVDDYVASFEPLESILQVNEHLKNILLPVLGVSPVKSWYIDPLTLRFSDRPLWADLSVSSGNDNSVKLQQIDFLVRLTMMPSSRDSIMHFITPALTDLSASSEKHKKPEEIQLMLDHCLSEVFTRAVIQTMRFCSSFASINTSEHEEKFVNLHEKTKRCLAVKSRTTLLWKQLSQDLVHRYQLRLIDTSEVFTQLVHEVKNLRPAARDASIASFFFLVFDYFSCTQNGKTKPPLDVVLDLLQLYTLLYSGPNAQYQIGDAAQFFRNASAVVRMAPASLWNNLYLVSPETRMYAMNHRPPALAHHFAYIEQWRNGLLPSKTDGIKLNDADNGRKLQQQTDIEHVIAANAFSNDEETFGALGLHFLDQLLPAGHIQILTKASATAAGSQQQQQTMRKNPADSGPAGITSAPGLALPPAINHSSTFGTKVFDYPKPLSWSIIDMMTILTRSKLAQSLKMSYMKFHSTMNQALMTSLSAATSRQMNLLTPQQQQRAAAPPLSNADGSPSPPLSGAAVQALLNVVWMSPGCIETYAKFLLNGVTDIHSLFARAQRNVLQVLLQHCSPQQQNLHAYHHFQAGFLISFSPIIELYSIRNAITSTPAETIRALQSLMQFQSENHFLVAYNPAVSINTWRVVVQTLSQGFDLLDLESIVLTSKPLSPRLTEFDFITDKYEEIAKLFILLLAQASHITGHENHRVVHVKQQLVRLVQSSGTVGLSNNSVHSLTLPWYMVLCMPEHMQRTLTDLNLFQPAQTIGALAMPSNARAALQSELERTAANVQSILIGAVATATESLEVARTARLIDYFTQPASASSGGNVPKPQAGIMPTMPPTTLYLYLFSLLHKAVSTNLKPNVDQLDVVWANAFNSVGGLAGVARVADGLRTRRRPSSSIVGSGPLPQSSVAITLHYDNIRTLAQYIMTVLLKSCNSAVAEAETAQIVQTLSMLIFNMGLFTLDSFLIAMLLAPSDRSSGVATIPAVHRFAVKLINAHEYTTYLSASIADVKVPSPGEWLPFVAGNRSHTENDPDADKPSMCEANLRLVERYPELMYFNGQVRSQRRAGSPSTLPETWYQLVNCSPVSLAAAMQLNANVRVAAKPSTSNIEAGINSPECGQPVVHYITPPQYFMNLITAMLPCVELLLHSLLALLSVSLAEQQQVENKINGSSGEVELTAATTDAVLQLTEDLLRSPAMLTISVYHPKPLTMLSNTMRYYKNALVAPNSAQQHLLLRLARLRRLLCRAVLLPFCHETVSNTLPFLSIDVIEPLLRAAVRRNIVPNFSPHFATFLLTSSLESKNDELPDAADLDRAICDIVLRDYGTAVGYTLDVPTKDGVSLFSDRNVVALLNGDHDETRMYMDQIVADLSDSLYSYYTVCSTEPQNATISKKNVPFADRKDVIPIKMEDLDTNDLALLGSDSVAESTKQQSDIPPSNADYLSEHTNACVDYRYSEIANTSKRILLCAMLELAAFQLDRFILVPTLLSLPERIEVAYHYADYENDATSEFIDPSLKTLKPSSLLISKFCFLQQLVERRQLRVAQHQDSGVDMSQQKLAEDIQKRHEVQEITDTNQLKLNVLKLMNCIAVLLANMPATYLDVFYDQTANAIEMLALPKHSVASDHSAATCSGVDCDIFELLKITAIFTQSVQKHAPIDGQLPSSMVFSSDKYRPALALHLFRNVCMHLNTSRLNTFMRLCLVNPGTAGAVTIDTLHGSGGLGNGRWAIKIDTEAKLIFMLHCFGPILDRFKYESHTTTHKVRYATLQLLAQVDKNLAAAAAATTSNANAVQSPRQLFQHVHTISDFFYILKYLYTGDARLYDSDKLAADLHCPAMKLQLKFLVAPESQSTTSASATATSTSEGNRTETPQPMSVDVAALPSQQQPQQRLGSGLFRNIHSDNSRSSTPNAMQLDVSMGK